MVSQALMSALLSTHAPDMKMKSQSCNSLISVFSSIQKMTLYIKNRYKKLKKCGLVELTTLAIRNTAIRSFSEQEQLVLYSVLSDQSISTSTVSAGHRSISFTFSVYLSLL